MNELIDFAILAFTSLFVIVDPIGAIPAFLVMTPQNTVEERSRSAAIAALTTLVILILSYAGGQWLFTAFHVTLPAFEIAGGIILLLVGLDMVQARRTSVKETKEEQTEGIQKHEVAVTPLAIPMLAGPGAITAVILLANKATNFSAHLVLAASILLVSALTYIVLRFVAERASVISVIALKIMSRLMGLLLTAIAVQFIINGVKAAQLFTI